MAARRSQSSRSAPASAGGTPHASSAHGGGLSASWRPSSACRVSSIRVVSDRLRGVLGGPLSPVPRLAPRRGRFFSQAAVKPAAIDRSPVSGRRGDRVERVLDPAAADLVLAERLQQGGPLRILPVPGVLPVADPLPDDLVDLRDRRATRTPRRAPGGAGVRGRVLRRLHLLQGGPLRLVLLQAWARTASHGARLPVAGPVRRSAAPPGPRPCRPAGAAPRPA